VTGLRRQAKNFHHVFSRWDTIPDRDRQMSDGQTSCNSQCCVKYLRLKDEDKDEDLKIGPRGQGFSSRQQHCCEAVQWDQHELEPDRGTMANKPPIRHSVTARRWCL